MVLLCTFGTLVGRIQGKTEVLNFAWRGKVRSVSLFLTLPDTKANNSWCCQRRFKRGDNHCLSGSLCLQESLFGSQQTAFKSYPEKPYQEFWTVIFLFSVSGKCQKFYWIGRYWSCEQYVSWCILVWRSFIVLLKIRLLCWVCGWTTCVLTLFGLYLNS